VGQYYVTVSNGIVVFTIIASVGMLLPTIKKALAL